MKRAFLLTIVLLLCSLTASLYAQNSNPLDDMLGSPAPKQDKLEKKATGDTLVNDIIRVNYGKKNAKLAMMMSALIPGAGQFYADKSSLTAYIFPLIELAVVGGIMYYDNQGDKKVKEYKKYANEIITLNINGYSYTGPRYRRDFQDSVSAFLGRIHSNDIYDGIPINYKNQQHYYEDIGKYNKFIFGWMDWYCVYGELPQIDPNNPTEYLPIMTPNAQPIFIFDINEIGDPPNPNYNSQYNLWQSNVPLAGPAEQKDPPNSKLRAEYIKMRQAAEDKYRVANYLSFGIALNHIASAIDAVRVTNKKNNLYLSQNDVHFQYYTAVNDGRITPMFGMSLSF